MRPAESVTTCAKQRALPNGWLWAHTALWNVLPLRSSATLAAPVAGAAPERLTAKPSASAPSLRKLIDFPSILANRARFAMLTANFQKARTASKNSPFLKQIGAGGPFSLREMLAEEGQRALPSEG